MSANTRQHVAVLGAGGRVGRAVTETLLRHEYRVTAVLRDPTRHELPRHAELRIIQGDAQRPRQLTPVLRESDALVLAVTPFTAPPTSFDGFDRDYYATIVAGIEAHWPRRHRRLVAVGLTATMTLDSGGTVMDDPALFPPRLRPFAEAHMRTMSALANMPTLDWAVLTPPAGFGNPRHGDTEQAYDLVIGPVSREQATADLSHAAYADAVAAELTTPTVRAARAAVLPRTT